MKISLLKKPSSFRIYTKLQLMSELVDEQLDDIKVLVHLDKLADVVPSQLTCQPELTSRLVSTSILSLSLL